MSSLTITNSFTSGTTISSSQVNTNFSDISTYINNRNSATATWDALKVSATSANPVEFKSSAASCEVDLDCTGTNGSPFITFRRSGTTYFTIGVNGAGSNLFTIGTSSLTTNNSLYFDSSGNVALGTTTFTSYFNIRKDQNATTDMLIFNNNTASTLASSRLTIGIGGSTSGHAYTRYDIGGPVASWAIGASATNSNNFSIGYNTSNALPTDSIAFQITSSLGVYFGNGALATSATDGHLFIRTCAGTPTGTVSPGTGRAGMVYDTTANKIWFYNGSWRGVTVS